MEQMSLPDAVAHDRQVRRKESRRVYAERVGITEGRVHALEHGRKIKEGEAEALQPWIGDLTDLGAPPQVVHSEAPPPQERTAPPPTAATPEPPAEPDYETKRKLLAQEYLKVLDQLGERVPPIPWPSMFRLETVPPVEFPTIWQWLFDVGTWLAEQDGTEPPQRAQPVSEPGPVITDTDYGYADDDYQDGDTGGGWEPPSQEIPPAPDLTLQPQPTFDLDPNLWYVTNGELQTFKDCERRWYLSSYLQVGTDLEKLTGSAMVGTRFHEALATWYQPAPGDPWETFNSQTFYRESLLEAQGANEETTKQFNAETDLVRAMLEGYFQWIEETGADVGLRIVAPESVVSVDPKIPNHPNVRLLAKLDVEVEKERDNSRAFIDHKTGSNFHEMVKVLQLDEQMQHYNLIRYLQLVEANAQLEIRVAGAIYNMARRVKRTPQADPPFYGREEVQFNLEQIRSYWMRVKGTLDKIAAVRQKLDAGMDHREVAPPRPSRDCYWKCEYFTLCPMMDHSPQGAADYINEALVHVNPLKRYEPDAMGITS